MGAKYIRNCYAKLYTTMTAFSPSGKGHSYNYACEYKYRKRDYVCKYSDGDVNHTQTSLAGISRDIYVCNVNMLRIFFFHKTTFTCKKTRALPSVCTAKCSLADKKTIWRRGNFPVGKKHGINVIDI